MSTPNQQQFLEPGQRVMLKFSTGGGLEDNKGVRRPHTMAANTEVVIFERKLQVEEVAIGSHLQKATVAYYSFKKEGLGRWENGLKEGVDVGRSQLIPHKLLSETRNGSAKDDFYKRDVPLFVLGPFDYKGPLFSILKGDYQLKPGDMVFVLSDGRETEKGRKTDNVLEGHYHFQRALVNDGPKIWTSETLYTESHFDVLQEVSETGASHKRAVFNV